LISVYCHGVLVYIIKILSALLNDQVKSELYSICVDMFQHLKSNQKHEYPCYMFFKGITNFKLLTAAESVGIAFLLSMFTIPLSGQLFWNTVKEQLQPNGETVSTTRGIQQKYVIPEKSKLFEIEEEASGIICDVMDILYVLKMNLAFYAWYK